MRTSDFDFELPESSIARYPPAQRDGARLLRLDRATGAVSHHRFIDLPRLLRSGDRLVTNNSKVLPARIRTRKVPTGGRVEVLLVEPTADDRKWRALLNASKRLRVGAVLAIEGDPSIEMTIVEKEDEGFFVLELPLDAEQISARHGAMPLPPYLARDAESLDEDRYQTIFARADRARSVAAPTAGLHFTPGVLQALASAGVEQTCVTLHVGPGTFLPVRVEDLDAHRMHAEQFEIEADAVQAITSAQRVVAVGTTVVRTLESQDELRAGRASTRLFIRPGFEFRHVDAMLTNFHLPRSTLLMLVCAFAGRERTLAAYRAAVDDGYRFYSYGDAMLIE